MLPPYQFLYRLNVMACSKKCDQCKCEKPCDTLPIEEPLYTEVDDTTFAPYDVYTHKEMDPC